jgi:hypothetical protein
MPETTDFSSFDKHRKIAEASFSFGERTGCLAARVLRQKTFSERSFSKQGCGFGQVLVSRSESSHQEDQT